MTTCAERILLLAMTVLGPLARELPSDGERAEEMENEESPLRSLLGRSVCSVFGCVEWNTLKTMAAAFGTVERCLRWLATTMRIPDEDIPRLRAGAEALREWEAETEGLDKDLRSLQRELERVRAKCDELTIENAGLREKCDAYSEAGVILEQDRQQLQSLLTDKCKLAEENQHLEREISSLQELLEFATENVTDEDGFDGEVGVGYGEDASSDRLAVDVDSPISQYGEDCNCGRFCDS